MMGRGEIINYVKDKTIKKKLLLVFSGGRIASELLFFPLFSTFFALNLCYSCNEYQLLHFYIKEESVKFSLMPQGWVPKDRLRREFHIKS